jgi:hypothetical protein
MNMENNHFDELLYSLPDYIKGELDDDNVKEQIEAKLLTDSSFREEYESLKATMSFIQDTELESPSEVYFANLQANILSKVHKEKSPRRESILAKLAGYWKVAVPALAVCVVLFIYSQNMNTPQLPLKEEVKISSTDTPDNKTQAVTPEKIFDEIIDEISNESSEPENNTVAGLNDENHSRQKRFVSFSSNENIFSSEEAPPSISEEGESGGIIFSNDDVQAQDEYDHLSTDDQLDILQSLREKL